MVIRTCECCNYSTSYKCAYDSHINSKRHKNMQNKCVIIDSGANIRRTKASGTHPSVLGNDARNVVEASASIVIVPEKAFECTDCRRRYSSRSGLYRHQKKCIAENVSEKENTVVISSDTFIQLTTELKEIKTMLVNNTSISTPNTTNNITNNNNNNNYNNNINIYLNYLNTHCKDALNINQFIDTLQFDKEDFKIIDKNRFYVQGANKILQNKMEMLPMEKRPLRCITNMFHNENTNQPVPILVHDNDEWKPECPAVIEYWLNYSNFENEEEKMVVMRLIERYNDKLYDTYKEMLSKDTNLKRMDDKLSICGQSKTHIQMLRELSDIRPLHLDAITPTTDTPNFGGNGSPYES